ncbi:XRE family transcriptional regulator [Acuticoccus sp. MNP-M23]|uniref:XRE family transcriptional regulator n=1 Tax=Acuticoccus sp. MNP-M23 TaxID=3072793 RepID=UPI0028153DB6|nr:XRE family transcriptional regulator [Acuticoccus sp. MNP-M23]WMS41528.1 XRE family transcriptional regulator [Acuticoccus sp. MNP-M23]
MQARNGEGSADPYDLRVGQRLRSRRKARRMTLDEVASASAISTAQLSMIERGLASPSVKGLREICRTLDISVAWLFEEEDADEAPEQGIVVRRHRRKRFDLSKKKMHKELLTPDLDGKLQFLWIEMQPGGSSGPEKYFHEGEETGLILSGRMRLVVEDDTFTLEEGDSFRFDSHRPHRFENAGDTPCKVLWVCTPPFY